MVVAPEKGVGALGKKFASHARLHQNRLVGRWEHHAATKINTFPPGIDDGIHLAQETHRSRARQYRRMRHCSL